MKVQTGEDAKASPSDEKAPAERSSRSVTIDYELKPAVPQQSAYINVSKLVLLILAIIATFLACLIFARDLWGTKNVEKHQVIHHQKRIATPSPTENLDRLPLPDDFLDDFPGFPFRKDSKDEDKDGVVSKVTKITFRMFPNDKDEVPEKIKFQGPMMEDNFMDDIVKTMMNMMNAAGQNQHPANPHSMEKLPMFGNIPMFGGQNPARHPKLIIVRRIHPSPNNGMDDDLLKNILDGISGDSKTHESFPLIPSQNIDPIESIFNKLNNDFPSIKKIMVRPKKPEPAPAKKESTDASAAWAEYKSLISKLAAHVDTVLDEAESLKGLVDDEIVKNKETPTTETSSGPGKEDDSSKEKAAQIKNFYADVKDTVNKMGVAMTEASVLIKTEDGAMDLIKTTDKKTLMETIDSFTKAILEPLDEVFSASTNLTKTNGNENNIPEAIYKGMVDLGHDLIRCGKIVYEDVAELRKSLDKKEKKDDKSDSREIVDSGETIDSKHDSEDNKMAAAGAPKVVRRIVLFNAPLQQMFPLPMAGLKPEPPFIKRR